MAAPAPPLPTDLTWLNVARPLRPEELAGWLRVLCFWSGGSVASHHATAVLDRLQRRFAGEPVVVIAVHAARHPHERSVEAGRAAVLRQRVLHPVVLDADHRLWSAYGARTWPTVVLLDPAGRLVARHAGELDADLLEAEVAHHLARARADGQELAVAPLPLAPEPLPAEGLLFPSKLVARGDRLWVGDGRGAVVEFALPPAGPARPRRRFDGVGWPQGLALDEARGHLYAADAVRHLVWRIALAGGDPEPVAGTGELGAASLAPGAFAPGRAVALRSPWDLCWDAAGERLLIAMAGAHQIWAFEPARDRLRVLAGSGREARHDGDGEDCAFAQPSGLALDGPRLWVGDAGGGCIRALDLPSTLVRTVAGGDLLDVGHVDGAGEGARFQHPTGLALLPGGSGVVVADGYNGALRRVERAGGVVTTLATPGLALLEPDGLAFHAGRLLVADSGHHRVVAVDPASGAWEVVAGAGSG